MRACQAPSGRPICHCAWRRWGVVFASPCPHRRQQAGTWPATQRVAGPVHGAMGAVGTGPLHIHRPSPGSQGVRHPDESVAVAAEIPPRRPKGTRQPPQEYPVRCPEGARDRRREPCAERVATTATLFTRYPYREVPGATSGASECQPLTWMRTSGGPNASDRPWSPTKNSLVQRARTVWSRRCPRFAAPRRGRS